MTSPIPGDVETAVAFLTELNGGTCPGFELSDGDLIARCAGDLMLYRSFNAGRRLSGERLWLVADDFLESYGLLSWAEDAVAARGVRGRAAEREAVALAEAIDAALVEVEGWLWAITDAAARSIAADPPCGCPAALDREHGDLHTQRQHRVASCGGPSAPAPCGGCYDCLADQAAYYATLEGDR